jgi:hypothetical protein
VEGSIAAFQLFERGNPQPFTICEYQSLIQVRPVAMESKADLILVDMEPSDNVTLSPTFQVDVKRVDITNSVATLSSGASLFD